MKNVTKFFMAALLAGMCSLGYTQNVNVNIDNQEATTKEDCAYRINGICSSEDIGGVNVDIVFAEDITWAVFTNYNSIPVTILYEIGVSSEVARGNVIDQHTEDGTTGSIVLGVDGTKKVRLDQARVEAYNYSSHEDVTKIRDNSSCYYIKGIIVRKLSN